MTTAAVIVAAGKGIRFNYQHKKQFISVSGHPVLAWTLNSFELSEQISSIILVVPSEDFPLTETEILDKYRFSSKITVIKGGKKRQDSVFLGLSEIDKEIDFAAIHDGVRAGVTPELIDKVCSEAYLTGAALPALRTTDSAFTTKNMMINSYFDRDVIRQAQTPQVFRLSSIIEAHKQAQKENIDASDDGMLYRKYIGEIKVVEGDPSNIKLTHPEDMFLLENVLNYRNMEIS